MQLYNYRVAVQSCVREDEDSRHVLLNACLKCFDICLTFVELNVGPVMDI